MKITSMKVITISPPEPPPDFEPSANLPKVNQSQKRWTAAELLDAEFPEPKWAIEGLIPEGLTIIGGRPKVGKSWLLLQAAIAVGTGGRFFGKQVDQRQCALCRL